MERLLNSLSTRLVSLICLCSCLGFGTAGSHNLRRHQVAHGEVTFGTLFSPKIDKLPLHVQLLHQLHGCFANPGAAVAKVMVIVNGKKEDIGFEAMDMLQQELGAVASSISLSILEIQKSRLDDREFLAGFFNSAHSLRELLPEKQKHEYALAALTFLDQCHTNFCAWQDEDILVRRPRGVPGWIDNAVELLQSGHNVAAFEGGVDDDEPGAKCDVTGGNYLSSRYFVLSQSRFRSLLPLRIDCKVGECDSLEAMLELPAESSISIRCALDGAWAIHPLDDTSRFLKELKQCGSIEQGLAALWEKLGSTSEFHLRTSNGGENLEVDSLGIC